MEKEGHSRKRGRMSIHERGGPGDVATRDGEGTSIKEQAEKKGEVPMPYQARNISKNARARRGKEGGIRG